jgi:hypothetical protein
MSNNVKVIIEGQNNSKSAFDQLESSVKGAEASAASLAENFENLSRVVQGFIGAEKDARGPEQRVPHLFSIPFLRRAGQDVNCSDVHRHPTNRMR